MSLDKPLSTAQIDVANGLYNRLPQWQASDRALCLLNQCCSGSNIEATLLKVAAINQLYGTQVFAVVRMAQHIQKILAEKSDVLADVELVEQLVALPKTEMQQNERR